MSARVCTCSDAASRHGPDDYGRLHRGPCRRPGCGCRAFVYCGDVPIIAPRAVLTCQQTGCEQQARVTFVWPGKPRARICAAHLEKLLQIAEASGIAASLDLQPVGDA